jgi:hypothetical protein
MLLRYFSLFSVITFICSLLTTSTFQIANAAQTSVKSIELDKLTVKRKKEASVNVDRQSEIASIHHTLTQLYRGYNECNINLVSKYTLWSHERHRRNLDDLCTQVRLGNSFINYKVKNIELISLSDNKAIVVIDVLRTYKVESMQKLAIENTSNHLALHKVNGRWIIHS